MNAVRAPANSILEARMQARFGTYPHALTDTIQCPRCGTCGVINWDLVQTPQGPRKDFAGLSSTFYERLNKKPPYEIEIVCNCCGVAVQRGAAKFQVELTPELLSEIGRTKAE